MQDGEVDYSRFSPRQLMIELVELSPERFPRNRRNALAMLRTKWPDAPEDLATVDWWQIPDERIPPEPLANGALRFQVRYDERRPHGIGEPLPNNLELHGVGTATVDSEAITLTQTPLRPRPQSDAPAAVADWIFKLEDVTEVLHRADDNSLVIAHRDGRREVTLWMQTPADAQALLERLPQVLTPGFAEQQERTRTFAANLRAAARVSRNPRADRDQRRGIRGDAACRRRSHAAEPRSARRLRLEFRSTDLEW
jgi:hypothetical protein